MSDENMERRAGGGMQVSPGIELEFQDEDGVGQEEYDDLIPRLAEPRVQIRHFRRAGWSRKTYVVVTGVGLLALVALTASLSVHLGNKSSSSSVVAATAPQSSGNALLSSGKPGGGSTVPNHYAKAAVASENEQCSVIGCDALRAGGSAVDAAIATLLCNGVLSMQSMGVGGGFFMTVYSREKQEAVVIDAREEAPGGATEDMFKGDSDASQFGGLAVAVPGELRGYRVAHDRYGKLPWKDLIMPTVRLCRKGFLLKNCPSCLARKIQAKADLIMQQESMRDLLVNPRTGKLYRAGEVMRVPRLADTLEAIALNGSDAIFYDGEIGEKLVADVNKFGGNMSMDDLRRYEVKVRDAISVKMQRDGDVLHSVPPPGGGAVLLLATAILDGYKFDSGSIATDDVTQLTYHRVAEAFKFGYAHRLLLGDPAYVNMTQLVNNVTSSDYAASLRARITDGSTHDPEYYGVEMSGGDDHGTSDVAIVASNGDAVSVTSTINTLFGAMRRSPSTGVILNNEMDDFSSPNSTNFFDLPPSPSNFIRPRARPVSSMCPAILVDRHGDVRLVIGASGGSLIPSATTWAFAHNHWFEQPLNVAIDTKRLHHQLIPNELTYEAGFSKSILRGLATRGHQLREFSVGDSVVQAIEVLRSNEQRSLLACSDWRKGGLPDGY